MHGPVVIVHSRRNRRHARPDPGTQLLPRNGRIPADTQATTRLGITPQTRRKVTPPQRKRQTTVAGFPYQSGAPQHSYSATSSAPHRKRACCRRANARPRPTHSTAHDHASPRRSPSSAPRNAEYASRFPPHAANIKPTDEPTNLDSHTHNPPARRAAPAPPSRDESHRHARHGGQTAGQASPPATTRPAPRPTVASTTANQPPSPAHHRQPRTQQPTT